MTKSLTPKQQRFADEYLVDLNACQAAIRAGYSPRSARSQGYRLLTNDDIQELIQKGAAARTKRVEIDADWVLKEQVRVYRKCMTDVPVLDKDGNPTGEYRFEHNGANRALENLGKHINVGAFKGTDDAGTPIDTTWTVRFVDAKPVA
jgi:phage terminase small subunit